MHNPIMYLFGGLGLFMFGMSLASDHLQRMVANRVRELLASLSDRPVFAIFVGIALTILMQSSGAVTSMLVGLGSAEVITLARVMGVIVGTGIGSTFTVQLISLNIVQYGLSIFFVSFFVYFAAKKRTTKNIAGAVMGFGLLFWGLEMMRYGTNDLKTNPHLIDLFAQMQESPLLALVITAAFTVFVQSSSVTIGLAMSLASSHVITLEDAFYWVYGANIGTTSTGLMAAMGANYVGRQVAWAHVLFKGGGVVCFYFFTPIFVDLLGHFSFGVNRDIANAHTAFNVLSALLFLPFISIGSRAIEKSFGPEPGEREFGPEYIVEKTFGDPTVAYERARRETLRLGDIVKTMVNDSVGVLKSENVELMENLMKRDNQVDLLHREIKMYLVQFTDESNHVSPHVIQLISFVSDLEAVGDVVDKSLLDLARKKQALKLDFSREGWDEICHFHREVLDFITLSLSCFHLQDRELAAKLIEKKRVLRELEQRLKECHLDRLHKGLKESINTSSIHLEVLANYRRIVGLLANQAYSILKERKTG